jgi:hypothetical protein
MPIGLSDLVPDSLFYQNQKQQVIRFLKNIPAPGTTKRNWLFQWALWVGMRLNKKDYDKVQEGAPDA